MSLAPWANAALQQLLRRLRDGRLPHAIALTGAPGLGKRELADAFARLLLCTQHATRGHACGACRTCVWVNAGSHPDWLKIGIEEEATQIKIDQIRALNERLTMRASAGPHQVAIIDPADQMGIEAFNALLKTLEEPTPGTVMILLADQLSRLPATIRSRCQLVSIEQPDQATAQLWLEQQDLSRNDSAVALAMSGGNPGAAKAMLQSKGLQALDAMAKDLQQLLSGKRTAAQLALAWAPSESLGEDLRGLTRAMQLSAQGQPPTASWQVLAETAARADFQQLSAWWERVNRMREQLRAPLKHDLHLLQLLRDWQVMMQTGRAA